MLALLNKGPTDPSTAPGIDEVLYKYIHIKPLNTSKRRWPEDDPDVQGRTQGGHCRQRIPRGLIPGRSGRVLHLVTSKLIPVNPEPTALAP